MGGDRKRRKEMVKGKSIVGNGRNGAKMKKEYEEIRKMKKTKIGWKKWKD